MNKNLLSKSLLFILGLSLVWTSGLHAQICQNPHDSIYSMSTTGVLYPINVNNATNGVHLDSLTDGNAPQNANGVGFSSLNGKFYYFERSAATVAPVNPLQQFVSYDPATKIVTTLSNPVLTAPTTSKIRSGCVNNAGTGYYTIDPTFSGATAAFYYYSIASNTWTQLTTSFDSVGGAANSLNGTLHGLNSGDMAFDGLGNLWVVASNTTQYSLYKFSAPLPTTAVAKMTATQIIKPTTLPASTGGKAFTGIAFNSTGALYLTTGSGNNHLYKLSNTTSAPVLIGTLPIDDIGGDLTSCSFPLSVLPATTWNYFNAELHNYVELKWNVIETDETKGYQVEYSTDATHWNQLAFMNAKASSGSAESYSYTHQQFVQGSNFYRIVQTSVTGKETISAIKSIIIRGTTGIQIGPNPAKDAIYIYKKDNTKKYRAQIFDRAGILVYSSGLNPAQESVNISSLQKGTYILKLSTPSDNVAYSFQFVKW